ncbi:hypothetical protein KP509_39G043100 [Ceratopteris richardii]|uniref:Uncharacterized protein n=1 Tax=Ceratopteris richardii TaxID=49495 RepID=A0A8T2Q0W9_CERRI|nr:hypothetical protein KP509_39G043100 [Ceratopteris richardii]
MGDHSAFIYSFIARKGNILAEYTSSSKKVLPSGNFKAIAEESLRRLPAANGKSTFSHEGLAFNFLIDEGFTYAVVSDVSLGRQIPIAFLERVKEDFKRQYGNGKCDFVSAHGLDKEYGSKLKDHMQYCVDHPDEMNKLSKVRAQVTEVKGIMMENIEKVLDRGEKIELLVDKSENLRYQADNFQRQGRQLRRRMWLENMKIKLVILGILILLILIIWLAVCHGFNCKRPASS